MSGRYWRMRPKKRWDDDLSRMDPFEFERLMGEYYRRQGYRVVGGKGRGFDGGIDLKLYRNDEYVVVQCKRYTASIVTHNDLHELLGVMQTERATRAIFINTGEYSRHALEKLQGIPNFEMIDGAQLREMLGSTDSGPSEVSIDGRIERSIQSETSSSRSDYSGDFSLTIPNASGQRATYRQPEQAKTDNGLTLFVALVIGILLVSCIRRLSAPADRLEAVAHVVAPRVNEAGASLQTVVEPEQAPAPAAPQPAVAAHQPTRAELREAQRKADEAMNVIKDSTPEM